MDENKNTDNGGRKGTDNKRSFPRGPQRQRKPGQQLRPEDDFNWNKVLKVVLSWSAIILLVFLVMTLFKGTEPTEMEVTYAEYQSFLASGQIERGTVAGYVRGASVSGDLYKSLRQIEALSCDGYWSGDVFAPYIQLGGVTITA